MKVKKSVLIAAAVVTLGAASIGGVASVNADSLDGSLAEKIASRFNLNKDEVEKTLEEFHEDKEAEHAQKLSERLQKKVDNGVITAEQKTLIEQKVAELKNKFEQSREELRKWAEENDIEMKYLMGFGHNDSRLDQAVEDGDITAEQRDGIRQKRSELKDSMDSMKDELEKWASDNDIEVEEIMPFGRFMKGGHRGHGPRF